MSISNLIENKNKKLIKDFHVSGDEVYNIDDTYILKISSNIEMLKHEKEYNDLLINKLPVCESVAFEIIDNKAYYLKKYIKGKNLCDSSILSNPDKLIDILVNIANMIHKIKNDSNESLIHGDLCLQNILVNENSEIVGIIDLAHTTFSNELWYDYAWMIWSLQYNLKTNKYTKQLLDRLNIEFNIEKYNQIISNEED